MHVVPSRGGGDSRPMTSQLSKYSSSRSWFCCLAQYSSREASLSASAPPSSPLRNLAYRDGLHASLEVLLMHRAPLPYLVRSVRYQGQQFSEAWRASHSNAQTIQILNLDLIVRGERAPLALSAMAGLPEHIQIPGRGTPSLAPPSRQTMHHTD